MRKIFSVFFMTLVLLTTNLFAFGAEAINMIDTQYSSLGIVAVNYQQPIDKRIRVLVEKDGKRYSYNIQNVKEAESFPLQMGNGTYTVRVMENVEGNKYKEISKQDIKVELKDENVVYLNSIQEIKWDKSSEAIQLASELTKGLTNDLDKVNAIYNYIVTNVSYDFNKINDLTALYLPNIDETLKSGQGICYDYASLFAAMLRSQGIPTKMVKGYAPNVSEYHAWNEVYIESMGQWVTIDTTSDAQMIKNNIKTSMIKDSAKFQVVNVY